jgi:HAD superfamily hydrolase (TIGR01509 family)
MGSISTIADTSELQRQAFNSAFREHGLEWRWERDDYLALLERSGGRDRIAEYAGSRGETVDAAAVHASKSRIFQETLAASHLTPRPGVVETLHGARAQGLKVALVTTTSPENVAALFRSLDPELGASDFDVVVDATQADRPKPAVDAYTVALARLGLEASDCVAVEDNVDGVRAAVDAGLACVAFPNENTAGHTFAGAERTVDRLELDELRQLAGAAAR